MDEKSNEIKAIRKRLEILELSGCLVTIAAMGRQVDIARDIVAAGADYVLAVKNNQPAPANGVEDFFVEHGADGLTHGMERARGERRGERGGREAGKEHGATRISTNPREGIGPGGDGCLDATTGRSRIVLLTWGGRLPRGTCPSGVRTGNPA